jgi:hypothetical protein
LFGQVALGGEFHARFKMPVDHQLLNFSNHAAGQANFIAYCWKHIRYTPYGNKTANLANIGRAT